MKSKYIIVHRPDDGDGEREKNQRFFFILPKKWRCNENKLKNGFQHFTIAEAIVHTVRCSCVCVVKMVFGLHKWRRSAYSFTRFR